MEGVGFVLNNLVYPYMDQKMEFQRSVTCSGVIVATKSSNLGHVIFYLLSHEAYFPHPRTPSFHPRSPSHPRAGVQPPKLVKKKKNLYDD